MREINANKTVVAFFSETQDTENTLKFVSRMRDNFKQRGYCYFAVDRLDSHEFIGFIGLMDQDFLPSLGSFVDIGWRLNNVHWGCGFATEGAKACLNFGFDNLRMESIYSVAPIANEKSIRVMEKICMSEVRNLEHPKLVDYPKLKDCVLYEIQHSSQICWRNN
jgi:RimJ/RimL family protein N-acetyltransferase